MRLLIAGIVPALVIVALLMIQVSVFAHRKHYPRGVEGTYSIREVFSIIRKGLPAMLMPVMLMVGMLSGYFSPTEVGAITVTYALILSAFYGELSFSGLLQVLKETLRSTVSVLFIVASAAIFAWTLTVEQLPQQVSNVMLTISSSPAVLLLVANVVLLIAGMFIETTAAIMVLTPILLPPLVAAGVSPIHFGVVMVLNLMIGMISPPVGMSVYMLSPIVKLSVGKIFRAVAPYYVILLIALILVTYIPQFSLALPGLMFR